MEATYGEMDAAAQTHRIPIGGIPYAGSQQQTTGQRKLATALAGPNLLGVHVATCHTSLLSLARSLARLPPPPPRMTTCVFGEGFASAAYRLFELDEAVLHDLLKDNGRSVL